MAYCYFNDGNSMVSVDDGYVAKAGEFVFRHQAVDAQLNKVFPGRADRKAAAAKQAQLNNLENDMHRYIDDHYSLDLKLYLIMSYNNPNSSSDRKAACLAAGNWVDSVVTHFGTLVIKLNNDETLTEQETDWSTLFDSTDPEITLLNLPV